MCWDTERQKNKEQESLVKLKGRALQHWPNNYCDSRKHLFIYFCRGLTINIFFYFSISYVRQELMKIEPKQLGLIFISSCLTYDKTL